MAARKDSVMLMKSTVLRTLAVDMVHKVARVSKRPHDTYTHLRPNEPMREALGALTKT